MAVCHDCGLKSFDDKRLTVPFLSFYSHISIFDSPGFHFAVLPQTPGIARPPSGFCKCHLGNLSGRRSQLRTKPGATFVEIQVIVIAPPSVGYCAISEGPFALPPKALWDQVRLKSLLYYLPNDGVGRIRGWGERIEFDTADIVYTFNKGVPEELKVNSRYCLGSKWECKTFRLTSNV